MYDLVLIYIFVFRFLKPWLKATISSTKNPDMTIKVCNQTEPTNRYLGFNDDIYFLLIKQVMVISQNNNIKLVDK